MVIRCRRFVGDPLVEALGVRERRRALVCGRIVVALSRRSGVCKRLDGANARPRDSLPRLVRGVLLFLQPPTPWRFSHRSHAAMTIREISARSRGSLMNSGTVERGGRPVVPYEWHRAAGLVEVELERPVRPVRGVRNRPDSIGHDRALPAASVE